MASWLSVLRRGLWLLGELLEECRGGLAHDSTASAATTSALRDVERREAGLVLGVEVGAAFDEQLDDAIAATDGGMERRIAGIVGGVDRHAAIEQQADRLNRAFFGRHADP